MKNFWIILAMVCVLLLAGCDDTPPLSVLPTAVGGISPLPVVPTPTRTPTAAPTSFLTAHHRA